MSSLARWPRMDEAWAAGTRGHHHPIHMHMAALEEHQRTEEMVGPIAYLVIEVETSAWRIRAVA